MSMDANLIPKLFALLIPLAGIAFPLAVLAVVLHFRERQRHKLFETVKHFADRGMPVPRELLDPPQPPRNLTPRYFALTLIGAGAGVALMFHVMDLPSLMGIGGLLVCVGLAQWLALTLDARDAAKQPHQATDAPRA